MSGTIEAVHWKESAEELHTLYKAERGVEARKRLGALWLVRRGESVNRAAETAGVGRRTLTRWLSWYTEGGLEEVLSRVPGHGAVGTEWMRKEHLLAVLEEWALEAVVWERAPSHTAKVLSGLPTATRVFLPSYSPQLNPAERIFEEVRRRVEGKVYEDLEDKRREAEGYLLELRGAPERVRSMCGWRWLRKALGSLPAHPGEP